MPANYRIAIVGAASLLGKELNDALSESPLAAADFVLMDDEEAIGQLESVGDEVTFIQQITPASFAHADFTFFSGSAELTRKHWETAARAGSAIIDLSDALDAERGAVVLAPWVQHSVEALNLQTPAAVPAHPAALMLALLLSQVRKASAVRAAFATVLEPASEYGRGAMDELHQQTVSLLSFQNLPKAFYDTQVAFNATPMTGSDGKIHLQETEARVRRHYALLSAGKLPAAAIQLVHAPVFHGHTLSLGIEVERAMTADQLRQLLAANEHIEVAASDEDAPSNLTAAGQEQVLVRVRSAEDEVTATNRFWLWAAADNLKLAAVNAVACALEMRRLRPQGQVQ
ncbi:MAG TPA: Asd/ArgC dimerization domain-containing protein [Acidobacteriaceae bacterium]|jgi:aspartate-semialdehyde dehydrogenase